MTTPDIYHVDKWQPIATAPRDGTIVRVADTPLTERNYGYSARFRNGSWHAFWGPGHSETHTVRCEPAHWRSDFNVPTKSP